MLRQSYVWHTVRRRDAVSLNGLMTSRTFALGTFVADGRPFAALVLDGRVAPLEPYLGAAATVRALLEDWSESLRTLQSLADRLSPAECVRDMASLRPLPPVYPPGQVFQAGANYREHLIELTNATADRVYRELTEAERRQALESIDERARTGAPYVFTGVASSLVGALDDIVLPAAVTKRRLGTGTRGRDRTTFRAAKRSRSSPATRSATTSPRAIEFSGPTFRASGPTGWQARTGRRSFRPGRCWYRRSTSEIRCRYRSRCG